MALPWPNTTAPISYSAPLEHAAESYMAQTLYFPLFLGVMGGSEHDLARLHGVHTVTHLTA
jgi:hypothetical protein